MRTRRFVKTHEGGKYQEVGPGDDKHTCAKILLCFGLLLVIGAVIGFLIVVLRTGSCKYNIQPYKANTPIRTIAFGSCARDDLSIFSEINADVLVFLGDNVYADTGSPTSLQATYDRLSCKPEFQDLVNRTRHVLSIWDDHDYGYNDVGADNPIKNESKSIFSEFWKIPDERRLKAGVYGSYVFNMSNGTTVSIIVPDLRFFREPLQFCEHGEYAPREKCYCPTNRSLLGDVQWAWLEDAVNRSQRSDALTIIASSTQFGHAANGYESWTNFPRDRARLRALLDPRKSLVISGDVHWGEISVLDGLVDVTSSGFSEVDLDVLPNANRLGNAVPQRNYGLIDLENRTVSIYGVGHKRLLSVNV